MKHKHRIKIKQGLSLLLAVGIALTNPGAALSAFAEDAPATPETAEAVTPETAEADTTAPNLVQITENLYNDLPDAPTGSYLGSMGLPVATGETKIGISAWVSDLYDGVDAHMDADALNADENTVTIGKTPGTDYAIVPLLAQVEYPADGAVSEIILPEDVELLSYLSTDYEPIPADEQEQTEILHQTYSEQSAAATGLYVKASADFTAQLVYTDSDGSSQSKSIHVQISEDAAPTQMYADTGDDGIAAYAAGPTPPYATGKITSIAKEGGTWLIWFNGQEAYCCSHGLNGQPKGCPTYSFSHVSRLEPGQYTPGNHYANQVNIWGGLGQLSLDMLDDRPVVASLEDDPEGGEEQPNILGSLYDETQQWIMENYPDSYAAQTYIAAAEELINGTDVVQMELAGDEYIDPADGLIHCKKCGGQRQTVVPCFGKPGYFMPRCICQCQREAEEQRKAAEERQRRMERIKRRKAQGLQDRYLYDYTFANDNGQNPLMDKARAYVENWKEAYRNNTGLLLFGDVGTGKSFFAGCIANALLDRDVPVLMTNFPTILNRLTGMFSEDRSEFIASFDEYDLLIIDDLGVERSTEYAMEQMFFVIDSRYRSRRPMIITTNLKLAELKNPPDLAHARIYDRILERCAPILFAGKNFREENAGATKQAAKDIVNRKHE